MHFACNGLKAVNPELCKHRAEAKDATRESKFQVIPAGNCGIRLQERGSGLMLAAFGCM